MFTCVRETRSRMTCLPRLLALWLCLLAWNVQWAPVWSFFQGPNFFYHSGNMIIGPPESIPVYGYNQEFAGEPNGVYSGQPKPVYGEEYPVSQSVPIRPDQVLPVAISSRHSIAYRDTPHQMKHMQQQALLVEAAALPLTIIFKSASSSLNIHQDHVGGEGIVQTSQSHDEPHRLYHHVLRPIITEIHEYIMPYRKITRSIEPVQEDISTIVATTHKMDSERDEGLLYDSELNNYARQSYRRNKGSSTKKYPKKPKAYYNNMNSTPSTTSAEESLDLSKEVINSTVIDGGKKNESSAQK